MKTALILSGGGGRGAYQIGVIKALEELNIRCDIVTGASIGSINGAIYTEGNIKLAEEFWENINFETVFTKKITYSNKKELYKQYLEEAKHGGLEPTNLRTNLIKYLDIDKIYNSNIDYGLTTVKYPSLKLIELTKREIPKDKFIDYLMASSTVFPFFKLTKIDESSYMDGGFRKTIPVDLAEKLGATKFIIVNISLLGNLYHPPKNKDVIYIKPRNYVGEPLLFDSKISEKNIHYGYNDTMKVFKKLDGNKYTFNLIPKKEYKNYKSKRIYLNLIEKIGTSFEIDDTKIYTLEEYKNIIENKIKNTKLTKEQQKIINKYKRKRI